MYKAKSWFLENKKDIKCIQMLKAILEVRKTTTNQLIKQTIDQ